MYCSQCGAKVSGKFCSQCGAALVATPLVVTDWERDCRYEVVLQAPEVRQAIDYHARNSAKRMSGEQFLALCERLVPGGVPLELLVSIMQPLYASWGIGTGKQRVATIPAPVGRVLLRLLCALAGNGQTIRHVQQASDGCALEASIPSDMWSFEGDLLVAVHARGKSTEVHAATKIKGQLFDWGKSQRCLNQLFAQMQTDPAGPRAIAS